MLRHAFQFVKRAVFLIGPQNLRSQKAIEKLGGVRVGSRRDTAGRHSYLYEITSVPAPDSWKGEDTPAARPAAKNLETPWAEVYCLRP